MITDLAHVAFAVRDVDVSLAFYDQLGVHEAFRLHRDDGTLMLVYLHVGGDRFIELFPGGPAPDLDRRQSFMHICLRSDDIHADVERLRDAGVPIVKEVKEGLDHNLQAWIADPDGNKIELMQLSEESPQRETARRQACS
ncbi:MAG: VOC family protein [Thermomicrobiales bacterium]